MSHALAVITFYLGTSPGNPNFNAERRYLGSSEEICSIQMGLEGLQDPGASLPFSLEHSGDQGSHKVHMPC